MSPEQCPVCSSEAVHRFDCVAIQERVVGIDICGDCLALINTAAYRRLAATDISTLQRTEFYDVGDEETAASHVARIEDYGNILDHFLKREDRELAEASFLDFGAGRGYGALAASSIFARAVAYDFDINSALVVAESLRAIGELPENVTFVTSIDEQVEPFDVVFMWHVLEHLPEPTATWQNLRTHLQEHASFFIQIPLFRPEHVLDAHFVFFTEPSIRRWAQEIGGDVVGIDYDNEHAFLAAHVRLA